MTASITAQNKVYDGTTAAVVAAGSLTGVVAGETVTLSVPNGQFDTKNVGTAKTVTANIALAGADAGNYSLAATTASTTANITARSISGSFTAANKVYDGDTSATVLSRAVSGRDLG